MLVKHCHFKDHSLTFQVTWKIHHSPFNSRMFCLCRWYVKRQIALFLVGSATAGIASLTTMVLTSVGVYAHFIRLSGGRKYIRSGH